MAISGRSALDDLDGDLVLSRRDLALLTMRVAMAGAALLIAVAGPAPIMRAQAEPAGIAAPAPGAPVLVSETDRLKWENLQLKLANQQLEVEKLQRQVEAYQRQLAEARERLDQEWRMRYGVGVSDVRRTPDGFVRTDAPKPVKEASP